MSELSKKADTMFKRFPASQMSRLHHAIISDPASLVRDSPDDSRLGQFFAIQFQNDVSRSKSRSKMSAIVEAIATANKWKPAQTNAFLEFVITKMRDLDPNTQKREIARDLVHGEMAGLPGFRDEGREAPIVRRGTNYGDLPEGPARRIADFLKEKDAVGETTKNTIARKRREVGGRRRRRTLKKTRERYF